jgi:transposase
VANIVCGADVSAERLDARIGPEGAFISVARSPEGIAELAGFCREHGVELVVMEATGGYEKLPFALLWEAGVPCAILNPRSVRRFAEAMGFLEKTDRIDAGVMAYYAVVRKIVAQEPQSGEQQRLKALVTRLRQLTALKVCQGNQRRLVEEKDALASIDEILALVRRQTKEIEGKIAGLLGADPLWRALDAAFREIKGVAGRTVANLMAEMPEIGTLSGKAAAKLTGVAPLAKDSGKRKGKRQVRGGRAPVRGILYVVAAVVARHEPDFAAFHARLLAAGLSRKAARIAVARKLLVRLNAKARDVRAELAASPAPA